MRLTTRGKTVVGICVVAVLSAALYGPRALNAVVLPGALALGAAYLQVRRTDAPRAIRTVPADDHVGRGGEVTLRFADRDDHGPNPDVDRPFVGRVRDIVGEGLSSDATSVETVVGTEPVTYEVTYEERGQQTVGPAELTARDVLGLVERELTATGRDEVLAYPPLRAIAPWARRDLRALHETGIHEERSEFDRLREYTEGDSLRDIHWVSTAKQDELIVKEFAAEAETEAVTMAAGAAVGSADEMAEAVASVAVALLEDGVPVEVRLPGGAVTAGPERGSRVRLLERLATVGSGRLPDTDADLVVFADDETTITLADRETTFTEMTEDRTPRYHHTTTE
ncbi:MAG: DUF58 domain-containing protein, partial [Halobaculum sp.]